MEFELNEAALLKDFYLIGQSGISQFYSQMELIIFVLKIQGDYNFASMESN